MTPTLEKSNAALPELSSGYRDPGNAKNGSSRPLRWTAQTANIPPGRFEQPIFYEGFVELSAHGGINGTHYGRFAGLVCSVGTVEYVGVL
jgi:hypothetical protein